MLVKVTLETLDGSTWSTSINPDVTLRELTEYFFAETGFNKYAGFNKYDGDKIELVKTITIHKE